MLRKIYDIILRTLAYHRMPICIRVFLLNLRHGYQIDKTAHILSGSRFTTPNLIVGSRSFIGRGCFIFAGSYAKDCTITIGKNVQIAHNVNICCVSHEIGDSNKRAGKNTNKSIMIKDGCWIGTSSVIMPGVTINEGCVIGANSLVTKDCEKNGLYLGCPAKRVKDL